MHHSPHHGRISAHLVMLCLLLHWLLCMVLLTITTTTANGLIIRRRRHFLAWCFCLRRPLLVLCGKWLCVIGIIIIAISTLTWRGIIRECIRILFDPMIIISFIQVFIFCFLLTWRFIVFIRKGSALQ
jgi:hypothetical protein